MVVAVIIGVGCIVIGVGLYACCIIASIADDKEEEMLCKKEE